MSVKNCWVLFRRSDERYLANPKQPLRWGLGLRNAYHFRTKEDAENFRFTHRLSDSTMILIDRSAWRDEIVKALDNE